MTRRYKRPSRLVLHLARERFRALDGLVIFGAGLAIHNVWLGLGLAMAGAGANLIINRIMESYR